MHRRSFLSLAAGTVSAAALGQSSASVATPAAHEASSLAHPVLAHQDRTGDLHRMTFSTLAFKVVTQDTQGSLFAMESTSLKKGGPPRHVHPHQDEWFYVLEGEFIAEIGDKPSPSTPATPSSVRVAYPTPGPASATALEDCS
jgi:mannose-6-phosphate isomerase-like protein (cupin superfamily)